MHEEQPAVDDEARTRGKLQGLVSRRLEPFLPSEASLRGMIAKIAVAWLGAHPSRIARDRIERVRLTKASAGTLDTLGRTLRLIRSPTLPHGQQAAEVAAKLVRGIEQNRLSFEALLAHAAEFRSRRSGYFRSRAGSKQRAPRTRIRLLSDQAIARRVSTTAELHSLGRHFENCLAERTSMSRYPGALRSGDTEFWWIGATDDVASARWCISLSSNDQTVEEFEHRTGGPNASVDRAMLLAFLSFRRARADHYRSPWKTLADIGICNATIRAAREELPVTRVTAVFGARSWRFEGVPGALAAWPEDRGNETRIGPLSIESFLLQAPCEGVETPCELLLCRSPAASPSPVEEDDEHSFFDSEGLRCFSDRIGEACVRVALRRAADADPRLRDLLVDCFGSAPWWFRLDWIDTDGRVEIPV